MKLSALIGKPLDHDPDITGLTADSRQVRDGYVFAALEGVASDGVDYIPAAEENGAVAILTRDGVKAHVPVIADSEPRRKLAQMAAIFYPAAPGFMAGITGTNGKTSTAQFASQIWHMLGVAGGSLGTLGVEAKDESGNPFTYKLAHTTPDPVTLHKALNAASKARCTNMAMEVSSHGLAQYRCDGIKFDVAAFTNITQDHLDYHPDFADYFSAKKRLFLDLLKPGGLAIINEDGAGAKEMRQDLAAKNISIMSTGYDGRDLRLQTIIPTPVGLELKIKAEGKIYDLSLPLVGGFQAENVLLATAIVMASGHKPQSIIPLLGRLKGVPGRMMLAAHYKGAGIYVDYAHTPDAVATALKAARPHAKGKLIAILGAGGDRDRMKRPLMGKAAVNNADRVIITDDNPRTENAKQIRADILSEAPGADNIGDRGEAIAHGVSLLQAGDVLMILGKGHETGQIVGDIVMPFDDAEEVRKLVA